MGFEPTDQAYNPVTGLANRLEGDVTTSDNITYASDAVCSAFFAKKSPDLAVVIDAWASLPEVIRTGIIAMVKAAKA